MAIVDMKKISVIGLGNDKEQIIKEIMKAGTVEISDIDMGDDSQLTEIV
jgi:vacuolar-type H+-ATPase subunit I/STV1